GAAPRRTYRCQACGHAEAKWLGRCPGCGEWSSLVEELAPRAPSSRQRAAPGAAPSRPGSIAEAPAEGGGPRRATGIGEIDRVLGGGLVAGSFILLGGDPGIGKSTLLLQALDGLARRGATILYVSGEESVAQTAMRARRLGVTSRTLLLQSETNLERILAEAEAAKPAVLAIDSIQTIPPATLHGIPG